MRAKRPMSRSVTVRLSARLERRLKSRAARQGQSPSELIRSLIEREVDGEYSTTLYERAAHILETLEGDPSLPHGDQVREALEDWNPDRRG